MTPAEYLNYLLRLANLEESSEPDSLFGLFQGFRPRGAGVEKVFAPLDLASKFTERILPIYQATISSPLENAYFIVAQACAGTDETLRLGESLAAALVDLSAQIGDTELSALCRKAVVVPRAVTSDSLESDEHLCFYEAVLDWFGGMEDRDRPESVLHEAFYSIACDPWLSLYLRWPQFEARVSGDAFAHYFALWRNAVDFAFVGDELRVGPRA